MLTRGQNKTELQQNMQDSINKVNSLMIKYFSSVKILGISDHQRLTFTPDEHIVAKYDKQRNNIV